MHTSKSTAQFYNHFASIHDKMLPIEQRLSNTSFFTHIFKKTAKASKILDCACGTGIHVILLSKLGYRVDGMDLSPGMVQQAKKNLQTFQVKATIKTGDFRKIGALWNKKYEVVACLGNSLAYMQSQKDVKKALKEMFRVLEPNGMFMMSQRNYDKLLQDKKKYTVTQKDEYTFLYIYDYLKENVIFNIIVGRTKNHHTTFQTFKTIYRPILQKDLVNVMKEVGYKNIRFYNQDNRKGLFKFDTKKDDFFTVTGTK
jgi:ubiquinone/menaquinone biosynthesis C-methylase UbiE